MQLSKKLKNNEVRRCSSLREKVRKTCSKPKQKIICITNRQVVIDASKKVLTSAKYRTKKPASLINRNKCTGLWRW